MDAVSSKESGNNGLTPANHPCFNDDARHTYARVHLPVAPRCNMQCNYCDRNFSCVNESRPGVACTLLSPRQALDYVRRLMDATPNLSVVGIAGPGDPFANPEETMETLRLVRDAFPGLLLCVATNGLDLLPYVAELAGLHVSHVTLTVNAVDPAVSSGIYAWMRHANRRYTGTAAAELLWENQRHAIRALKEHGVLVKINTILIPGVNDQHIPDVARTVTELGTDILNIMPLYPTNGTVFGSLEEPSAALVGQARRQAEQFLPQMSHCSRCRADAAGLLGTAPTPEQFALLRSVAQTGAGTAEPAGCAAQKCGSGVCGDEAGEAAAA